ncbi:MAG: type I toxin-antitoxin system toxin Ldr family protein [Escherichia coli]|nr:type I toxin-antitoxin system toxin Ldr family protein [Escherichia coli]
MTLAELGMAFWHDLAEQAEVTCHAGVRLP